MKSKVYLNLITRTAESCYNVEYFFDTDIVSLEWKFTRTGHLKCIMDILPTEVIVIKDIRHRQIFVIGLH